eukprot:TRINITY_DN57158_c0_g1_i1.p1 TRINITY_DN57158_c0_g1~~TRINITY_DN57158_c0_g1_i1.p1  ORF type:complete len:588 (+),score=68.26 TRINITY_DN57158_c0_g1_i1:57-1766(+)
MVHQRPREKASHAATAVASVGATAAYWIAAGTKNVNGILVSTATSDLSIPQTAWVHASQVASQRKRLPDAGVRTARRGTDDGGVIGTTCRGDPNQWDRGTRVGARRPMPIGGAIGAATVFAVVAASYQHRRKGRDRRSARAHARSSASLGISRTASQTAWHDFPLLRSGSRKSGQGPRVACSAGGKVDDVRVAGELNSGVPQRRTPQPNDSLLRVARGLPGRERTPVWLMRQAGRYMKDFRKYSERYPFRLRSETSSIATELSLQCWRRFGMDGVIVFSDILTPLPALGIEFDVIRGQGPVVLGDLGRSLEDRLDTRSPNQIRALHSSEDFADTHSFLRTTLQNLRKETDNKCTLLGFVGAPWTLAAYSVEGGGTTDAAVWKRWMYERPEVATEFLERLAISIASYAIFQIHSGAQCIQIFDSWAQYLGPEQWVDFAAPHVRRIAEVVREACPGVPLIYFAHGGSPYLRDQVEALAGVVEVLGIDSKIRLSEAMDIVDGSGLVLQGNTDPYVLRHGSEAEVRGAVRRAIDEAGGPGRHIMNLGHGVLQQTPEENVLHFVDEAQTYGVTT